MDTNDYFQRDRQALIREARYRSRWLWYRLGADECEGVTTLAIAEAAKNYNPGRASFRNYARYYVMGAIRRRTRRRRRLDVLESCALDSHIILGGRGVRARSLARASLRQGISQLTPIQRRVVWKRFVLGQTLKEVAKALGISMSSAYRVAEQARETLKAHACPDETSAAIYGRMGTHEGHDERK